MKGSKSRNNKRSEREFHCKGSFKALRKGKPDDADIAAVKRFARGIVG